MRSILTMISLTVVPAVLLGAPAFAANRVQVQMAVSVYAQPDFDSPVIFTLTPGEQMLVSDRSFGGFRKIKAVSGGRSRVGYITASDLSSQDRPAPERRWGLGGGLVYTQLNQGEKSFKTNDDVEYKITGYSGSNINPAVSTQWGRKRFWRLHLAYKTVKLEGEARTGIAGAQNSKVQVEYKMAALGVQFGWSFFSDIIYAGAGLEVDKALSGKVRFGNQDLSNQTEYPDYLGAHAFAGAQLKLGTALTAIIEGRYGVIANQQPVLNVIEVAAALLYWPSF